MGVILISATHIHFKLGKYPVLNIFWTGDAKHKSSIKSKRLLKKMVNVAGSNI